MAVREARGGNAAEGFRGGGGFGGNGRGRGVRCGGLEGEDTGDGCRGGGGGGGWGGKGGGRGVRWGVVEGEDGGDGCGGGGGGFVMGRGWEKENERGGGRWKEGVVRMIEWEIYLVFGST